MVLRTAVLDACPFCCSPRSVFVRSSPARTMPAPLGNPATRRPPVPSLVRGASLVRSVLARNYATVRPDDASARNRPGSGPLHHHHHHRLGHRSRRRGARERDPAGAGAGAGTDNSGSLAHKHVWPAAANPTPYEILGLPQTAAYQKKYFYALAKQYHPDLRHAAPAHLQGLAPAVRLERYRLLVAANDVLSNAHRRRMYDLHGHGWAPGEPAAGAGTKPYDPHWRRRPGTAAYNATWEDWERWRQENGGGPSSDQAGAQQTEQFMSNGGFAVVVLLLVSVVGWGQMSRAATTGAQMLALRDQHHEAISASLREQKMADALLSREDRVWNFLERREWSTFGQVLTGRTPPPEDT